MDSVGVKSVSLSICLTVIEEESMNLRGFGRGAWEELEWGEGWGRILQIQCSCIKFSKVFK